MKMPNDVEINQMKSHSGDKVIWQLWNMPEPLEGDVYYGDYGTMVAGHHVRRDDGPGSIATSGFIRFDYINRAKPTKFGSIIQGTVLVEGNNQEFTAVLVEDNEWIVVWARDGSNGFRTADWFDKERVTWHTIGESND